MVHAELELEPVFGGGSRRRHHAGVVDEEIDSFVPVAQCCGSVADRCERREIQLLDGGIGTRSRCPDVGRGLLALADRTHSEHNRRAMGCERTGCFEAETGVRPRDDRCPTSERRNVCRRPPFGSHAATERLPRLTPVLGVPVTAALRAVLRRRRELIAARA